MNLEKQLIPRIQLLKKLSVDDKSYEYLKPKRIEFFDNKNIIDISCGERHCLALSSEGLVYGWGDNNEHQFDKTEEFVKFLTQVLTRFYSL